MRPLALPIPVAIFMMVSAAVSSPLYADTYAPASSIPGLIGLVVLVAALLERRGRAVRAARTLTLLLGIGSAVGAATAQASALLERPMLAASGALLLMALAGLCWGCAGLRERRKRRTHRVRAAILGALGLLGLLAWYAQVGFHPTLAVVSPTATGLAGLALSVEVALASRRLAPEPAPPPSPGTDGP
jgi:hypothetical protein